VIAVQVFVLFAHKTWPISRLDFGKFEIQMTPKRLNQDRESMKRDSGFFESSNFWISKTELSNLVIS